MIPLMATLWKLSRSWRVRGADVVELPASKGKQRWSQDPEDDKFIGCAQAGKCPWLVTGDHDLLSGIPGCKLGGANLGVDATAKRTYT